MQRSFSSSVFRWHLFLLSLLLLQPLLITGLEGQQRYVPEVVRMKVLSPELGEEAEAGTLVERDLPGLTLTLALDDDPQTSVTLPAGAILELYRSKGKNRTGGFVPAALISGLGWIGVTRLAASGRSETDPSFGGDILLAPLVAVGGGLLFGPLFAPEEWEQVDIMAFFSETGAEKNLGMGLRIRF